MVMFSDCVMYVTMYLSVLFEKKASLGAFICSKKDSDVL